MTEYERQMISVACAVVDALKDLDTRMSFLEKTLRSGRDRQDAVWESIEIESQTLHTLKSVVEDKGEN